MNPWRLTWKADPEVRPGAARVCRGGDIVSSMAKVRATVTDRDLGWKEIDRLLKGIKSPAVYVGIRSAKARPAKRKGKGGKGDELNLAEIAAVNEFGSADGRVPERSFLRSTLDEGREKYTSMLEAATNRMLEGTPPQKALGVVGAVCVGDVQQKIANRIPPPNAEATIRRKGSTVPLIDTGRLRQSIDYEVRIEPAGKEGLSTGSDEK